MSNTSEELVSTGITGLDYILQGGFPANHLYLVEGDPGSGKTTLGLQFLLAGRDKGDSGLYVTLSETQAELRTVAASHGWSLDGIGLFELESLEERLKRDQQYTVFHPSEVELEKTTQHICDHVERQQATRVVFDSLSEMRLLARDPLRYRRQVLALKQFFAGKKCTVVMLDDRTSVDTDLQLQSISHGVVALERVAVEYGGARRRLMISKMRGLAFREGHHDFNIRTGGLAVYPRLVAAEHKQPPKHEGGREKAQSGIKELDSLLGGGLDYGTSTLTLGPAGSGKSTLISQFALALAEKGERAACYVFEETRENFLDRAEGLGMDLRKHIASGNITVEQIDPAEITPGEFAHRVRTAVEGEGGEKGARVVVIDSLNGYMNSMPSEQFLLIQMHELLMYLNERGVLTLLVLAQHGLLGNAMQSPVDVTYLADTVILLRYFEAFGEVKQAIALVKKRTGSHERSIREFKITSSGIQIGDSLKEFEGVLTGVPSFVGAKDVLLPQRSTE